MLKDFLYYDEKAINKYGAQISEKFRVEYQSVRKEIEDQASINLGLEKGVGKLGSAYKNAEKQGFEGIILNSIVTRYNDFEEALESKQDTGLYLDFISNKELSDLTSVNRNIIKAEGYLYIPEEFDEMEMIEENKEILMKYYPMETEEENDFMNKWFIDKENLMVPLKIEFQAHQDEVLGFAKVNKENFIVDYDNILQYEEEPLIFLFKSNGYRKVDKKKVVFSMVRDYLSIPRSIRRRFSLKENIDGIEDIFIDQDYLDVEILAIYK